MSKQEPVIAWSEATLARSKESLLNELHRLRARTSASRKRLLALVALWQGKHAMLKTENNKLRRKFQDSRSTKLPPGWTWGRNGAVCFVAAPGGEVWHGDTEAAAICAAMKALWERVS